jgi:DeoR/GlpR family transcriptional regulator of sugar metabolism
LQILAVLERDRRLVAKTLSEALGLSEDTIRRDLRELASEGLLQRVRGRSTTGLAGYGGFCWSAADRVGR